MDTQDKERFLSIAEFLESGYCGDHQQRIQAGAAIRELVAAVEKAQDIAQRERERRQHDSADEYNALRQRTEAAEKRANDLEAQLANVPIDAMLSCIHGPSDYGFKATEAAIERFSGWLEGQRRARALSLLESMFP